jgi:hypothetical protein
VVLLPTNTPICDVPLRVSGDGASVWRKPLPTSGPIQCIPQSYQSYPDRVTSAPKRDIPCWQTRHDYAQHAKILPKTNSVLDRELRTCSAKTAFAIHNSHLLAQAKDQVKRPSVPNRSTVSRSLFFLLLSIDKSVESRH